MKCYVQNFKITRVINTMNPFNWIRVSKMANKIMPESIILRYWSPILVFPYFFIGLLLNKKIKIIGYLLIIGIIMKKYFLRNYFVIFI